MIKLEVEEYCDGCGGFVPVAYRNPKTFEGDPIEISVRCETSRKCRRMYEHIKRHCEDPVDGCTDKQMSIDEYLKATGIE